MDCTAVLGFGASCAVRVLSGDLAGSANNGSGREPEAERFHGGIYGWGEFAERRISIEVA